MELQDELTIYDYAVLVTVYLSKGGSAQDIVHVRAEEGVSQERVFDYAKAVAATRFSHAWNVVVERIL
jgi:hypothetical protein